MDYEMPKMDGPQFIKEIRNRYNYKGLVISLTGSTLPSDLSIMLEAGVNFVMAKPLNRDLLFTWMEEYYHGSVWIILNK